MRKQRVTQQGIVFGIFVMLFVGFALFLPGFSTPDNMSPCCRTLPCSAFWAGDGDRRHRTRHRYVADRRAGRAAGLVLQMVQNGHSVFRLCRRRRPGGRLRPINGWLIAYAEVPSLFTTLASGLFLAGMGQAFLFQLDVVQWSPRNLTRSMGRSGHAAGRADANHHVRLGSASGSPSSCGAPASAPTSTAIGDNPFGARITGIPTRPIIVLQYVLAALIGAFAGLVLAASVNSMETRVFNSTLIYDVILVVRARRHRTFRRTRRRPECR